MGLKRTITVNISCDKQSQRDNRCQGDQEATRPAVDHLIPLRHLNIKMLRNLETQKSDFHETQRHIPEERKPHTDTSDTKRFIYNL